MRERVRGRGKKWKGRGRGKEREGERKRERVCGRERGMGSKGECVNKCCVCAWESMLQFTYVGE